MTNEHELFGSYQVLPVCQGLTSRVPPPPPRRCFSDPFLGDPFLRSVLTLSSASAGLTP